MVSASHLQRNRGSPPAPQLAGPPDVHALAAGTVQALQQAVEAQEAHVRLLRVRKAARDSLLHHTQQLLAAGNSIESHGSVEQLVHQVEASLHRLQQAHSECAAPVSITADDVALTSPLSPTLQNAAGDTDASADPLARIFHSGVEAQLAAVAEPPHTPLASTLETHASAKKRKKEAGESGLRDAARNSSSPPGVSPPPRSATMTALLAMSAARQEAGHAAMLAALNALELSLVNKCVAVEGGRDTHNAEPVWLRPEEPNGAHDDSAEPEGQQQGRDENRGDISSALYSDDFECGSSTSSGADD
ncbi:hypothetical protein, conserved [Leishmania tarentolae]|uniref:Uncharacterized protein n=1 Tax=Leishmania tarentolae TaxID=5689 RepID=A0A640KD22_LEITA|nr:hypothetical protein, conserved [Leishmania tarentolae]